MAKLELEKEILNMAPASPGWYAQYKDEPGDCYSPIVLWVEFKITETGPDGRGVKIYQQVRGMIAQDCVEDAEDPDNFLCYHYHPSGNPNEED